MKKRGPLVDRIIVLLLMIATGLPMAFWSLVAMCAFWRSDAEREALQARGAACVDRAATWSMRWLAVRDAKRLGLQEWLDAQERLRVELPQVENVAVIREDVEAYVRKQLTAQRQSVG